ncbi:binding-protein-dependent transport system inner membrane component [Coprobacillus sp. CAG:826]|nr:binding-protein-dependent transport system inner membrane component [Coprobacillus sp. CAG:826]
MQNNLKRSKHLGKYVSSAVLLIVCLLLLFPLIWGVISSFRDANDLRFYPGSFLPTNVKAWTIQNYIAIFSSEEYPVFNWIINSFIVALSTTFIYLAIASLAAYAFVFMDLKYANILFGFLIATMTVPGIVNTVPQFTNIIQMGLNKNLLGLILPGLCGVYGLYLIRQFFLGIPKDLIENARMDGSSNFRIFRTIVLPLGKSALLVQGLFSFLGAWNDLQWAELIIGKADKKMWTLAVGLSKVIEGNQSYTKVGIQLACSVISMIPIFILYCIIQDRLVEGVSMTGIKR